jgi:hypothetical protein
MTAALRGRRKRDELQAKRDLVTAYRTAAFSGAAFAGKLRPLSEYLNEANPRNKHAAALHFFHSLKARGIPVKIERGMH